MKLGGRGKWLRRNDFVYTIPDMMVTADTITDEQIRRLQHETSYLWWDAELGLDDQAAYGSYEPRRTARLREEARARLADAWNARHG